MGEGSNKQLQQNSEETGQRRKCFSNAPPLHSQNV